MGGKKQTTREGRPEFNFIDWTFDVDLSALIFVKDSNSQDTWCT